MELTATELWTRIQHVVRGSVPQHAFHTWIASARAVASTDDELVLEAQNPFHVEWLEDKFGPLLASAGSRIVGRPLRVTVSCAEDAGSKDALAVLEVPKAAAPARPTAATSDASSADGVHVGGGAANPGTSTLPPPVPPEVLPRPLLNERYTFDRFVVGAHNQLASAASRAVADTPAKMYNPLFLYGGVGLGKTHLMHAIGHHLVECSPDRRVCYVSSEMFMNELVQAIRQGTTPAFRARYRQMDLLLVDDVHFLEGKESTQEEFFHTFNALYDAQRQIVLTSDRPPKEMARLEERLVSRFEWGLVVDIRPPDYETRMAILRKKADDDRLTIDDEVLDFIAHSCTASVRELEGAVIKLLAYSSLTNQEITPGLARTALHGLLHRRQEGPVLSPERIRELVARRWRVRPDALSSKRRTKDLTIPRQVAMYLIKEALGMSLTRIGELFGGRDHSTVIHSIRKVEEEMQRDPEFRREVEAARDELRVGTRTGIHD